MGALFMKRSEKNQKKRKEIVEKVIAMLNVLDFKEATVRKICSSVNISIGTFYHYFSEKNDLVTEILKNIDSYFEIEVLPKLKSQDEIRNIIDFGLGFARYTNGIGSATGTTISTTSFPLPSTEEKIREEKERLLYKIPTEIIRRGQKKRQISADLNVEDTVDLLIISLRGHSLEWSRRDRTYPIEEKIRKFMLLFARALQP
jgi:AcrR family transcriptional regulator